MVVVPSLNRSPQGGFKKASISMIPMMIVTKKTVLSALAAASLLAVLVVAKNQSAEARGSGGMMAAPRYGADQSCFTENWGGIQNNCPGSKGVVLSTVSDNAGTANFQIRVRGVSGTARRVCCRSYSVDWQGLNPQSGPNKCSSRHDGVTENLPTSVGSHGWGATYALCWMDQGTLIRNYHH